MADTCLCEYTDHGHCGVVTPDGRVDNDASLELLAASAVAQARRRRGLVAPSAMMDGQVGAIRAALDAAGFDDTAIMAYAAKYAVRVLRPVPRSGRQRARVRRPALAIRWTRPTRARRCARSALDVAEGADLLMVKPAIT